MGKHKKNLLYQSGISEDNKSIISGVFELIDQEGIPLNIVIDFFSKKNLIINWEDFIKRALEVGWNKSTVYSKIEDALQDSLGIESIPIILKLKEYMNWR